MCKVHELIIYEMWDEIPSDVRILMPFSSEAAVFSTFQQEISFSLETRLGDYTRVYDRIVLISANRGRLGTTAASGSSV